ncbi:hypothetical protein [Amycolatopsis sp. H20-H5]|uniref:hypothetical protein n=1 Tax=Amycolatopsis sp. H20-H5 TaxID=3046309 RepID=UPI002DBF7E0F|nr:hypothetical protein [Amycolatopsis sp. H20-H5]MEC3982387.1 hypothetical protein [Amycolatopsis sp. H20-H5]
MATNLIDRMGSHLRAWCGAQRDPVQLRSVLVQHILACAGALSDDRQDALAISLAIDSDVEHLVKFQDRVDHLALRLAVSPRTTLRRINDAETELAAEIAADLSATTAGGHFVQSYYVSKYQAIVDNTGAHADPAIVVVHQEREIVCIQDGLAELPIRFQLPDHPDTPETQFSARVQHGGRIRSQRRLSPTGFELVLSLPSTMARRESHRFGLSFTFPAGLIRAHHVITGEVSIRQYRLIVKFHPDHQPTWIRKVEGEDIRTLDAFAGRPAAPYGAIQLDAVGEALLDFDRLSPHLAYGVQYCWAAPPTGGR